MFCRPRLHFKRTLYSHRSVFTKKKKKKILTLNHFLFLLLILGQNSAFQFSVASQIKAKMPRRSGEAGDGIRALALGSNARLPPSQPLFFARLCEEHNCRGCYSHNTMRWHCPAPSSLPASCPQPPPRHPGTTRGFMKHTREKQSTASSDCNSPLQMACFFTYWNT